MKRLLLQKAGLCQLSKRRTHLSPLGPLPRRTRRRAEAERKRRGKAGWRKTNPKSSSPLLPTHVSLQPKRALRPTGAPAALTPGRLPAPLALRRRPSAGLFLCRPCTLLRLRLPRLRPAASRPRPPLSRPRPLPRCPTGTRASRLPPRRGRPSCLPALGQTLHRLLQTFALRSGHLLVLRRPTTTRGRRAPPIRRSRTRGRTAFR